MVRSRKHLKAILFCQERKGNRFYLKFPWTLSTSTHQLPQTPISKSMSLIQLTPLFQPPGKGKQNGKHCHVLTQSFRMNLKDTSSNISIDPTGLWCLHDFKFSHRRLYSNMVVRNIQIQGAVISGKWIYKSRTWKQIVLLPPGKNLSCSLSLPPKQRQITHSP